MGSSVPVGFISVHSSVNPRKTILLGKSKLVFLKLTNVTIHMNSNFLQLDMLSHVD